MNFLAQILLVIHNLLTDPGNHPADRAMTLAPPPREDPPKAPVRMTAEVAAAQTKVHKALIKTRLHKQQLEVVYCQIGEVVKQGENKHLFPSRLYDITRITLLADGYNVSPDGGSGRTLIAW